MEMVHTPAPLLAKEAALTKSVASTPLPAPVSTRARFAPSALCALSEPVGPSKVRTPASERNVSAPPSVGRKPTDQALAPLTFWSKGVVAATPA